jgi:hypothetical protein
VVILGKDKNKFKLRMMEMPVENHQTAAWINIEKLEGEERIYKPTYLGVEEAKEYVDENRK